MCLWANYIFPRWVCLFCWRRYVDRSKEYINRSQTYECGNLGWGRAEKEYINGNAVAVQLYKDCTLTIVVSVFWSSCQLRVPKIYKSLFQINCKKCITKKVTYIALYTQLCTPHCLLHQCVLYWCANVTTLKKLKIKLKAAIRPIANAGYRDHTGPLF